MARYISTKDTAKLIRQALKAAFPGCKFSVRCGTGTASAWISVSYTDGPLERDVQEIVHRYEGRTFDGMTDGYNQNDSQFVFFEGAELPEEVRYCTDGVNTHRNISAPVTEALSVEVREALGDKPEHISFLEDLHVRGVWTRDSWTVEGAANRVAHSLDLTNGLTADLVASL